MVHAMETCMRQVIYKLPKNRLPCMQLAEAHRSINWYEVRIAELESSDENARLRQHQDDLAAVREAAATEARELRAQLLAAQAATAATGGQSGPKESAAEAAVAALRQELTAAREAAAVEAAELRAKLQAALVMTEPTAEAAASGAYGQWQSSLCEKATPREGKSAPPMELASPRTRFEAMAPSADAQQLRNPSGVVGRTTETIPAPQAETTDRAMGSYAEKNWDSAAPSPRSAAASDALATLLFGDEGSDVDAAEACGGGRGSSVAHSTCSGYVGAHVAASGTCSYSSNAQAVHALHTVGDAQAVGRACSMCKALWGALRDVAEILSVDVVAAGRDPAAAGVAVTQAAADAVRSLHEERMRAEALLFTLESSASSGAGGVKTSLADVGTSPSASSQRPCRDEGCGMKASACCESASMLWSASAELEALQQVNAQLLSKMQSLQAREVVPVAEARAAVARARTAAISESKARMSPSCDLLWVFMMRVSSTCPMAANA
jgi:hypothetical protein